MIETRNLLALLLLFNAAFAQEQEQSAFFETPFETSKEWENVQVESFFESSKEEKEEEAPPPFYYDNEQNVVTEEKIEEQEIIKSINKDGKYRLKMGDQLIISLYGFTEASTSREVTIDTTGSISYLFIEKIYALGKTIDEVRKILQEKISEHYPNVIVSATATQLFGDFVTVMGEVNQAGPHRMHGDMTLLKAIGMAGGFPARPFRSQVLDFADLDRSFVARDGEYVEVDFKRLIREGDLSQDIALEANDYIYVPSRLLNEVYVLGEFNSNFVYEFVKPTTLMEVVTMAGGVTELASSRICIVRGSLNCPMKYLVDFNLISRGCAPDFPLEPGDIIYAPPRKFTLLREIVRQAIRVFVGSAVNEAARRAVDSAFPESRFFNDDSFFIGPGAVVVPPPSPVFIGP